MPVGTQITLCIGAANRDPDAFVEPNKLDIGRSPNRHLAFGSGIHQCAAWVSRDSRRQSRLDALLIDFLRTRYRPPRRAAAELDFAVSCECLASSIAGKLYPKICSWMYDFGLAAREQ
jgi:hypothetical protein